MGFAIVLPPVVVTDGPEATDVVRDEDSQLGVVVTLLEETKVP